MLKKILILWLLIFSKSLSAQWVEQSSGINNQLQGVHFIDSLIGVAIGFKGEIVKTIDGGVFWDTIQTTYDSDLWRIRSQNNSTLWGVGKNGMLLTSNNQGDTWNRKVVGKLNNFNDIEFIQNDSLIWLVGNGGIILFSENNGNSWVNKSVNTTDEYIGIKFIKDSIMVLSSRNSIYRTNNNGTNWILIENSSDFIGDILFINEITGWICGDNGLIKKTTDGGLTWMTQNSTTTEWIQEITFVDENIGWAVGRNGIILYTHDGGEHWVQDTSPVSSHLISVDFIDKHRGWAVGSKGKIIKFYNPDPTLNTTSFSNQTLNIYPNPVSETSNIQFSQTDSEVQLALYDINGRNLGSSFFNKTQDGQYEFTRGVLATGLYYIVVENQGGVWSEKIVLE